MNAIYEGIFRKMFNVDTIARTIRYAPRAMAIRAYADREEDEVVEVSHTYTTPGFRDADSSMSMEQGFQQAY